MISLTPAAIEHAFQRANLDPIPEKAYAQLSAHLEILERWNTRLNLTAVRSPGEILQRHFVECAFAAQELPPDTFTLMDYGSGAGFPGMVIAICRPEISVTLAEAHAKKASFLREVIRTLGVHVEVYGARVEQMPPERQFHVVSMRAVEKMEQAIQIALPHVERYLALMTTKPMSSMYRALFPELEFREEALVPGSEQMVLAFAVPRGTKGKVGR